MTSYALDPDFQIKISSNALYEHVNPPIVSIIINNYNYDRFLLNAIDSALNQSYPNIEVIVVDDGSTDASRDIITRYGTQIVPILQENGGQASCYNSGFAASNGEIICFLDADDVFLYDKISTIVTVFNRSEDISWCFHSLKLINQQNEPISGTTTVNYVNEICDFRALLRAGRLPPSLPPSSCLCFRRSLLTQLLPMPTAQTLRAGDNYVKFMAVALGKGFIMSDVLTLQRIHDANMVTLQPGKAYLTAREYVHTAFWIRQEFSAFRKFSNKLLSLALCINWRAADRDLENTKAIQTYLASSTAQEKFEIHLRATYYTQKTLISKLPALAH